MAFSELSSALIVCPKYNSKGKSDATGVFQPEARALQRLYGIPDARVLQFDNHKPYSTRATEVLAFVASFDQMAAFIHLGHGLPRYIQAGFGVDTASGRRPIGDLVDVLAPRMKRLEGSGTRAALVAYYSCSTGLVAEGGLADVTRDLLCQAGLRFCHVMGHTASEHATMSPHAKDFYGNGSSSGGTGGNWYVAPGSMLWQKWNKALHAKVDNPNRPGKKMLDPKGLRLRYPFGFRRDGGRCEPDEFIQIVHEELEAT